MNKIAVISIMAVLMMTQNVADARKRYGSVLCEHEDYKCLKVKRGQSWHSLFPDPEQRDIVKRINRMNIRIYAGMRIAVPKNLDSVTIYDVAPFPRYIEKPGEKTIFISQKDLAWAAYDADGELVWWGPISPGKDWCGDVGEGCQTPAGSFRVIRKQGIDCVSSKFPLPTGGAIMPYCMHFFGGYAMHGSYTVPGYRASHGCVRMFIEDARWLNREFIDLPRRGQRGTKVIIGPPG